MTTNSPAPLQAAVVAAVQQLLAASGAGSVALPLGSGKMILAGEAGALLRMLGYATQPIDRLTRQTAAFLAATGREAHKLADHNSAEWKLFIAGCECGERSAAAGITRIREGDPAPGAAAASIPAGWKLVPEEPTPEMMQAAWSTANELWNTPEADDPLPGHQYRSMLAAAPAAPSVAPASESRLAEPAPLSTDESREYLIQFMKQHFTDKTFHRYILADRSSNGLAGDFAWQLARALRSLSAPAAPVPAASKGWEVNGGHQPVRDAVHVDVEFRNGNVTSNQRADDWIWDHGSDDVEHEWEIVRWRPAAPATSDKAE